MLASPMKFHWMPVQPIGSPVLPGSFQIALTRAL